MHCIYIVLIFTCYILLLKCHHYHLVSFFVLPCFIIVSHLLITIVLVRYIVKKCKKYNHYERNFGHLGDTLSYIYVDIWNDIYLLFPKWCITFLYSLRWQRYRLFCTSSLYQNFCRNIWFFKYTYIYLKCLKMAFRGKISVFWGHFILSNF